MTGRGLLDMLTMLALKGRQLAAPAQPQPEMPTPPRSPLVAPAPARTLPLPVEAEEDYLGFMKRQPPPSAHRRGPDMLREGITRMLSGGRKAIPGEEVYDYDAAMKAGATNKGGHWPSEFKRDNHPNLVVGGFNTKTGKRVPGAPLAKSLQELIDLGWEPATARHLWAEVQRADRPK